MFLINLIVLCLYFFGALIFLLIKKFVLDESLSGIFFSYFDDFVQVSEFVLSDKPYSVMLTSYPPIAILVMYPFAMILSGVIDMEGGLSDIRARTFGVIQTPQFWVAYLLYFCIFFTAIIFLLKKILDIKGKYFVLFCLNCFVGGMTYFLFIRGNVILFPLVFTLFFIAFYKSEKRVLREIALVSLALAGAIKIYPLIFGVLLLKDKKIFASFRVAVYTLLLFLLPFLLFEDGFSTIKVFLDNLGNFSVERRFLFRSNLSCTAFIYRLFNHFEVFLIGDTAHIADIVSKILIVLIFIFGVLGALISKETLSTYIICFCLLILLPPVCYFYVVLFIIIPFAEFINRYDDLSHPRRIFYMVFFATIPLWILSIAKLFIISTLLMILAVLYESITNIKLHRRRI